MKLLSELYLTHAPSRNEKPVADIVKRELTAMGIPFKTDKWGQIYRLNNTTLLSAHMDQVPYAKPATLLKLNLNRIEGNGNLGADDKNGIWIILNILKDNPHLSFIFSTCEEVGGNIDQWLVKHSIELNGIPYCLVFDRKGPSDIIGVDNAYCNEDMETDLAKIGKPFGFKPSIGLFSDCDAISEYLPCVNLSCGYYNAHTETEYTVISELRNSLNFGLSIVSTLFDKYDAPEKWFYNEPLSTYDSEEDMGYCEWCDEWFTPDEKRCPFCDSMLIRYPIDWEETLP